MDNQIFPDLFNQWLTLESEIRNNPPHRLIETSIKLRNSLYCLIHPASIEMHTHHELLKNRIDATCNYVLFVLTYNERNFACSLVRDLISDITGIYRLSYTEDTLDELFNQYTTDTFMTLNLLNTNWETIKQILLYTTNKILSFQILHTFFIKVLLHFYCNFGLKQTIILQFFSIEMRILEKLLFLTSTITFVQIAELLFQNITNNYIHNNLYYTGDK